MITCSTDASRSSGLSLSDSIARLDEIARTGACAELDQIGLSKEKGYFIAAVKVSKDSISETTLWEMVENNPQLKQINEKAQELGLTLKIINSVPSDPRVKAYDLYCLRPQKVASASTTIQSAGAEDPAAGLLSDDFGEFARAVAGAMGPALGPLLFGHGTVQRDDDGALVMVPQLANGNFSWDDYKRLDSAGELSKSMMMCNGCRVLVEVSYSSGYDFKSNMSKCPCCNQNSWSETEEKSGLSTGHGDAPRVW